MSWKRKILIGLGGLFLLLGLTFGVALYLGWFIPSVQVAEPGATGRRITEDGLLANYYGPGRGAPSRNHHARRL